MLSPACYASRGRVISLEQFAEVLEGFGIVHLEVEVDLLVHGDLSHVLEALLLVGGDLGGDIAQHGVVPLLLLDELLAEPLAARAAELEVHEVWSEDADIPTALQDVFGDDALTAVAADRGRLHAHSCDPPFVTILTLAALKGVFSEFASSA